MQIALISDLHFGIKKNSDLFLENSLKCIKEEFIPALRKRAISHIYILGDIFDNRNTINVKVKNAVFDLFNEDLKNFKIKIIVGNHDIYHKSTTDINSLKMFTKFTNIEIIDEITLQNVDGRKFLFVPWQVDYKKFQEKVADSNFHCDVCFGHFDINRCYMNKHNIMTNDGLNPEVFFNNYTLTFSGHFHIRSITKSDTREIIYLGTPYELNRNDRDEPKGFCILDTENLQYEFVDTKKYIKFINVTYPEKVTKTTIAGNIIDIHVLVDKDFSDTDFQTYLKHINSLGPAINPSIITKYNIVNEFSPDKTLNIKSTMEAVQDYVRDVLTLNDSDKMKIYEKIATIYNEVKFI